MHELQMVHYGLVYVIEDYGVIHATFLLDICISCCQNLTTSNAK